MKISKTTFEAARWLDVALKSGNPPIANGKIRLLVDACLAAHAAERKSGNQKIRRQSP